MPDLSTVNELISQAQDRQQALQQEHDLLTRAQGIEAAATRARAQLDQSKAEVKKLTARKAELTTARNEAVAQSLDQLRSAMAAILPYGAPFAEIETNEDGKLQALHLGWQFQEGKPWVPWRGLSGGQRVVFEAALAYALLPVAEQRVLILEAAELDAANLARFLEHVAASTQDGEADTQLIVCTCHAPLQAPEGWEVYRAQ